MALSTLVVSQSFTGDNSTTDFAIPVTNIESDSDEIKVYTRDESVSPATVELMIEGIDYELTGAPDPDSFNTLVSFEVAPATGLKVFIERVMDLTQNYAPLVNGQVNLDEIERAIDRMCAIAQQLDFKLQRALYFGRTSGKSGYELPDPEGDRILGYNSDGTAIINLSAADIMNLDDALARSNNLSDLESVPDALENLGIAPNSLWVKHAVTDGQSAADLTGETVDSATYIAAHYDFHIVRGTTVFASGSFKVQRLNGAWRIVESIYDGEIHGVTWGFSGTTIAQLRAALDSGAGNGSIYLSRRLVPAA